jgi:hypothetical protein
MKIYYYVDNDHYGLTECPYKFKIYQISTLQYIDNLKEIAKVGCNACEHCKHNKSNDYNQNFIECNYERQIKLRLLNEI